ncbi:MAG: hypothetical protein KAU06_04125 [Candidatus Marinimicrobia bacterium]|nr:hypothetical protein [Candidatus Neomarinimicrobiota bacterium]
MSLKKYSKNKLLGLKVELEALYEKLGYTVVYGKGSFKDGTCLIEKDKKVVINQYTPLDLQVDFMIEQLSKMDLSNVYILPVIRELVDDKRTLFD